MSKETTIENLSISLEPWAFFKLLDIKRKLASILAKHSATVAEVVDSIEGEKYGKLVELLLNVVGNLSDADMQWLISITFSNIIIDGVNYTKKDDIENLLNGKPVIFYKIIGFVFKENFSDFLALAKLKV
jgi:hypothetical protein